VDLRLMGGSEGDLAVLRDLSVAADIIYGCALLLLMHFKCGPRELRKTAFQAMLFLFFGIGCSVAVSIELGIEPYRSDGDDESTVDNCARSFIFMIISSSKGACACLLCLLLVKRLRDMKAQRLLTINNNANSGNPASRSLLPRPPPPPIFTTSFASYGTVPTETEPPVWSPTAAGVAAGPGMTTVTTTTTTTVLSPAAVVSDAPPAYMPPSTPLDPAASESKA